MEGNGEEMIWHGDGGSTPATADMIGEQKEKLLVPQLRFPAGFHFLPTDEELLDVYLRGKIEGRKPPLDVFMDVKILDWDPAKLVEERKAYGEGRYFFFTQRTEWPSSRPGESRRKLNKVKASWKATGRVEIIHRSGTDEIIGTRRILSYESSGVPRDKWSMNEYVLAGSTGIDQWVLCTIQEKLHWETKNSKGSKGKTTADTSSEGKTMLAVTSYKGTKCKRGSGTRREHKMTKRQKKEKTPPSSQPHETEQQQQQQQQQEATPDVSSNPPPLLRSDHPSLHEEEIMALDETTPMIQAVVQQGYSYEDQHYLDARKPPLMPHHQQGCHTWLEEQDGLEFEGICLDSILAHHQFDAAHAQYMLEPFNTMSLQIQRDQEPMPRFFPPADMNHDGGYQLSHQQTLDPLGTPEFLGDFIPTSQHELQFSQDPAKPSEQQTSPDTVQLSEDPAKPSEQQTSPDMVRFLQDTAKPSKQQTSPDSVLTCLHGQQWWYEKHTHKICFLCGGGGGGSNSGMK